MNIWENAIVTDAGKALLSKLVEGNTLSITRAETGEGYVSPSVLSTQTAVSYPKQALIFSAVSYPEEGKCKLVCKLTNDSLSVGYTAKQVGIYATDPDAGEILFMIVQALTGEGTIVPSAAEMPAFSAEWSLYFQFGQASGVSVIVDPSNAVSRGDMEAYVDDKLKDVKIPVDSSLDPYSENPVQNRVVYEAFMDNVHAIEALGNNIASNTVEISGLNSQIKTLKTDVSNVIPTITESDVDDKSDYGIYKVEGTNKKYWLFVSQPQGTNFIQFKIDENGEISRRKGYMNDDNITWNEWEKYGLEPLYGTEDLTAGTSPLETGRMYLVYE